MDVITGGGDDLDSATLRPLVDILADGVSPFRGNFVESIQKKQYLGPIIPRFIYQSFEMFIQGILTVKIPALDIILNSLIFPNSLQLMKLNTNRWDFMRNEMVRERKKCYRFPDTTFSFNHQVILFSPVPTLFNNFSDSFYFVGIVNGLYTVRFRQALREKTIINHHQPETRMTFSDVYQALV